MSGLRNLAHSLRRLAISDAGRGSRTARSLEIRPVLEPLESIELLSTVHAHARMTNPIKSVPIETVLPQNDAITGVRQDFGGNVAITGASGPAMSSSSAQAFVYYGPLNAIRSGHSTSYMHMFFPAAIGGEQVTSAQFYGPNTSLYDPRIGSGNVTAVGAYTFAGSTYQHSLIYTGPLNGSGTYTKLVAPNKGPLAVGSTVAHSTMGNLVVGNYDFQRFQAHGYGFIYDKSTQTFRTVTIGHLSTTIYGVWQYGGPSSTHYTIVGGYSGTRHGGKAFIENYNTATHRFSNLKTYSFANNPSIVTHFEGISGVPGGFSIAATEVVPAGTGASCAFIPVRQNGSFGTAQWVAVQNNVNGETTTGNTVIGNNLMGVYPLSSSAGVSSYIATVPQQP